MLEDYIVDIDKSKATNPMGTDMTAPIIISAQRFIDESTVAEKQANGDYVVMLSPVISDVDGFGQVQVVMDGHHSLEAARRDGVEPAWYEADNTNNDTVSLIERGEFADFFEMHYNDSNYYNVATGRDL